jgi:hypothetical protein
MVLGPKLSASTASRSLRAYSFLGKSRAHADVQKPVEQMSVSFRLAFVTLKNNLMVLSLRAMISQFVFLMLIAAFCFGGFLYALWT